MNEQRCRIYKPWRRRDPLNFKAIRFLDWGSTFERALAMARQRCHVCVCVCSKRMERADKMNISIMARPILYPKTPLAQPRKRLPLPQAQSESESSAPTTTVLRRRCVSLTECLIYIHSYCAISCFHNHSWNKMVIPSGNVKFLQNSSRRRVVKRMITRDVK